MKNNMKKIIITLLILSTFLIGCSNLINADTTVATSKAETKAETVTVTSIVEVENTEKIERLEADNTKLEAELEKYKELISGLNDLLGNVYYVYQKKSDGSSVWGTGFSIEYNGKYYLITAGHAVENEYGAFKNLGFKANFSNEWIYPKLLIYNVDYYADYDYAIFYSDKIKNGFIVGKPKGLNIILGNSDAKLNTIRIITETHKRGESGSPIINANGEVIGILTGGITYIDKVTEAIDSLK